MLKKEIFNTYLSLGSFFEFTQKILENGQIRQSSYVCIVNVHSCIEGYTDKTYANIVNNADIATPDGMPLVKGLKWLYGIEQDKISGPDLMPVLLKEAANNGLKVFFYGSTDNVLHVLKEKFTQLYPQLMIAGFISPPFRPLSSEELQNDIDAINNAGTQILFVALGCPKQERWMAEMKGKIDAVMIGVGGAFPMLAGTEKRAPVWMQKNMLEWLYRLVQDPKRLFKRYAKTNSLFIYLIIKEKIKIILNLK